MSPNDGSEEALISRPLTHDARHAMNESVHRTMNELREKDALAGLTATMNCECECSRSECNSGFEITIADYEAVRASGRRFVVAPGHEEEDEEIIEKAPAYFVIEKVGEQGRIADSLQPRSEPPLD
jgi:hypothetical protein